MKQYVLAVFLLMQGLSGIAQIAVKDEPRHHNVLENAYVRVLDVRVPPHDTTQMHKHETPSVFIVLHPVKTGSEVLMEESKALALSSPDPSISFEGFYTKPRIHRVWNNDTSEFHVMDIELLNKHPQPITDTIQQPGFQLLFDEKPVRGYLFTLAASAGHQLQHHSPFLIVGLNNSALQKVQVNNKTFSRQGDFLFVPAGDAIKFTNGDKLPYSFAVLELK